MAYQSLIVISYNKHKEYETIYQSRLESPATLRTNLMVTPYSKQQQRRLVEVSYPAFVLITPDMLQLTEKINQLSSDILLATQSLSPALVDSILLDQMLEEIVSTNEIEGLSSTKKDLLEARQSKKTLKFAGIVKMYQTVIDQVTQVIDDVKDFRTIYDEIFLEEIPEEERPDGKLFRKESVFISDKLGMENVHEGLPNEERIIEALNQLIIFMNNDQVAYLLKALITHYYFEYIHPFYDGNGRMGRFLLSSYLARKLDPLTALSVSEAILNNKKAYEKVFANSSHPKNKADLTPFILTMMEIIIEGQEKMDQKIRFFKLQMDKVKEFLGQEELTVKEKQILDIYFQNQILGLHKNSLTNKDLVERTDLQMSRQTIDKYTKILADKAYLERIEDRPVTYRLTDWLTSIIE